MSTTTINGGVSLRWEHDARALERHLALMAASGPGMSPGLRDDIGEYMLGLVQDRLDGDPQKLVGGADMPQSAAAIERDGKTLIDRHHLYDSYVYQLTPSGVEVGSNSIYARIHHFGGQAGRGHAIEILARPVLGMDDQEEAHVGEMILEELRRMQPGGLA
jgi:phage gpG-like protein